MFEKKRGKRFLASVMALVMLLSLAPVGALAVGGGGYGISVNLNETNRGKCNVYYAETKTAYRATSTDQNLTELNQGGSVTHDKSENLTSYGVIFFVAPHDGYALEGLGATASAEIYQSIVNNENLRQTDFWTKNSQIENLRRAGFTEEQIEALAQEAKNKGCVAAFIFTRSASNWGDINSNLNFTTHQLATFEKSITAVRSGDTTYTNDLNNVKVRVGDVITYSFKVTFYPDGNNITYSDIVVTDERLGGEDSRITFTDSSSAGTQTETKNYTVTSEDIRTGKLENTATLTYKYKAPYNVGAVNATATATARIATVSAVSYAYTGTVPAGAPNVREGVYSPTHYAEDQIVPIAPIPSLEGYQFTGWTAPADVTVDDATGTFTMPDKSITFTGEWIANKHSVTYKDETETISGLSQDNVAYGTTVTVPSYSKEGHTLTGWESDADNTIYSSGETFTMPDKDVTLTAQWTETDSPVVPSNLVKAKFFINLGGKDASNPEGTGTFTRGIEIQGAINLDVFNENLTDGSAYGNEGYIFNINGVETNSEYTGLLNQKPEDTAINNDINAKLPTDKQGSMDIGSNTNRQVVWYHVSHCGDGYHVDGYIKNVAIKITYNPNNGSFDTAVQVDESGNYKVDGVSGTTHRIIQQTPTRNGYTFTGWKLDGNDTLYQPEGSIVPTGDVTLVAQWEKNYTVIFNANGGAWAEDVIISDYSINENSRDKATRENLTASDTIKSIAYPTKNGATMIGWGTQKGQPLYQLGLGSGVAVSNLKSLNDVDVKGNTITLYAIWQNASADQCTYTIHQHFMKDASHEDGAINYYTTSQVASVGTPISSLIPDGLTNKNIRYKFGYSEYLYGEAKIGTTPYKGTETLQANNTATAIHLYYYLDEVGGTSKENPNGGPDNIPDAWQYKVTFQVVNGSWNDKTNAAIVKYVTKKDAEGNNSATGTAKLDTVPEVGKEPNGGYKTSGNWNTTLSTDLEITKDTVFTYTYDQKSGGGGGSGGSSRPSTPPTVDIPDDVPTGLNGKDHYAYIIGYGNNDVRPQNNITRAEVATIFFRLLTDETREANMTKSNGYNDVKDGDWFCCAVSTLSKMGIIKGYEDGSFKPNDPISRAEFAAIAARFDPDGDKTPASFADVTSHWAKDEISIAANHGWIKGYEDGSFKPDQKITRAETMTLVNRVLNRLPETKDDLHKDMKTWVDNMDETAWYYLAVQEATNSHYFKNKTSTKFEQWTDLRDTRDWSELEK